MINLIQSTGRSYAGAVTNEPASKITEKHTAREVARFFVALLTREVASVTDAALAAPG
jgi:hypothetical protein